MLLVDDLNTENFLLSTERIQELVEDLKVKDLVKVGQHELKAQLVVQFLPGE